MPVPNMCSVDMAIQAATDVFQELGPGHSEAVYQKAMIVWLNDSNVRCATEQILPITFRGVNVGTCRADIVTRDAVIELKTIGSITDDVELQIRKYMKLLPRELGLIINFPKKLDHNLPEFRRVGI